ncbi:DUF47 domain-containing protein [Arcanobacterium ihumii]|uniref:DUF47 domain-containing protein n=1 Tax=Arcanobacterium ihumii TaxID=2138162 RepID=UPI000F51FC33|nr:DUF47 family protein [Arcanobacterium ihumii]
MGLRKFSGGPTVTQLIADQSEHLVRAANVLAQVASAEPEARAELNKTLHDIENDADEACHRVLQKVNSSFVLPYDREDLFSLTSLIDDCVDLIDESGDNMVLYKVASLPTEAHKLVDIINDCARITFDALSKVDSIDEHMRAYWVEINQLENHGDTVYRGLISEIFSSSENPMEVLKMKFVLDKLESAIDRFETLAAVVETIAIKES